MLLMLCSNILGSQCDAVGVQLASYKIRSGRPLILSPQIDLRGGRLSGRRCLFLLLLLLFVWCVLLLVVLESPNLGAPLPTMG